MSRLSALTMAAAAVALSTPAFAADKAWSTSPPNNAFSGTNWTPGNVAGAASTTIVNGDAIFFGNSTSLVPNNDISGLTLASITFNTSVSTTVPTGVFTIGGNAITLTGNLTNNSNLNQTFNNLINFASNASIVTNTGSFTINAGFNAGTNTLTKSGSGILGLNAASTYSGGTTIAGGILYAGVNNAVGSGALTVSNVAGSQLQLNGGVTFANNIAINGGGVAGQGVIYMPAIAAGGASNVTAPINITAPAAAGGHFGTANSATVLNIVGDNTITTTVPVTVRSGLVKFLGAQNYNTGTILNGNGGSLQFAKLVSMPATGAITFTGSTASTIIVNAGGTGEFMSGSGSTTAGTLGGLLAGIGGQGAAINYVAGITLGVDTSNAAAPITYSSPWQSTVGSVGLTKLGAGTLNLTAGGTYTGAGGTGFPLIVRQGQLNLSGPTHAVTGETVVGGNFGTGNAATGFDATLTLDNTAFTTSTYISVGRGNGTGGVTSTLVANGSTLSSTDFSGGFNPGTGAPKFAVTLNNSAYTMTGVNFNLAESAGSNGTLTLSGSSALTLTSTTSIVSLGQGGTASMTLNDTSSFTTSNNTANYFIGRLAGSDGRVTLNGSATLTHNGAAAGTIVGEIGRGVLDVASNSARATARNFIIGRGAAGVGAMYNKGTLVDLSDGIFMGDGANSSSYFRNDNAGVATANANAGNIVVGIGSNSNAVFDLVSGAVSGTRVGGGFYQNGLATNGQYNITGGTLTAGATGFLVGDAANRTGTKFLNVNLSGTGTLVANGPVNLGFAADAATTGIISLNAGGTLVADTITTSTVAATAIINANGGTLRANASVGTAASPVLVGAGIDSIQVTGAGLTVDTNGLNKSIDAIVTDTQGFGVGNITLSDTTTKYVGRPLVKITDAQGTGATAMADWDPVTGQVTGITVTAPGSNYTQPVVTITGGGGPTQAGTAGFAFVVPGGLNKAGAGVLSLTAVNAYTGTTVVQAGTLKVKTNALGGIAATPLLTGAGGTDLQNGAVIFDYTGDTTPVAQIRSLLAASFQDASTPGIMETGQIRSTTATAKKGLGYRDDGAGNVLVQVALFGDADLDGGVSINDFNALAGNFGQSTGRVWVDGDFDYDGGVSINDFNLLAGGFGQSLPAGSSAWAGLLAFAAAHDDLVAFEAVTGVPEPTSLGLIAAGATLGLRRRRRAM